MFKWESKDLFLFTVIQHDWLKSPDKMEVEKGLQKISQKHRFDKSLASLFSSGKFSTCYLLIIYEMLKRSKKRRSQKHRSEKVFYLFSDDVVIVW